MRKAIHFAESPLTRSGETRQTQLIEAVIARARSAEAKAVDLSCHLRREEAHVFYEQCGFERTSYKFIRLL